LPTFTNLVTNGQVAPNPVLRPTSGTDLPTEIDG
jgi:hypothetical protein